MKKIIPFVLACIFSLSNLQSQETELEKYKYIIVSSKFDFVNKIDKYKTSSLTKFWFDKLGFPTYMDNDEDIPKELDANRCKALYASVRDDSGVFKTKSYVELRDCKDELVLSSQAGTSKLKDYQRAYYQSISMAFQSISKLKYSYDETWWTNRKEGVKDKKESVEKIKKKRPIVVSKKVEAKKASDQYTILTAKSNQTGYDLFDGSKVLFTILKTNTSNRFIIKDKNGTLVKENGYWLAEYYVGGEFVSRKYRVKF